MNRAAHGEPAWPPEVGALPEPARLKTWMRARQIVGTLRRDGMQEDKSLRIAIACAANWWSRQPGAPPGQAPQ